MEGNDEALGGCQPKGKRESFVSDEGFCGKGEKNNRRDSVRHKVVKRVTEQQKKIKGGGFVVEKVCKLCGRCQKQLPIPLSKLRECHI